jgi:hypothetical protein
MDLEDWFATSMSTNIAESAHAYGQMEGKHLTLVTAIQLAKKLDQRFLDVRNAANMGVMSRHGNQRITGRTQTNLKRSRKVAQKKESVESAFQMAQDLIEKGVSSEVVSLVLKDQIRKT